MIVEVVVGKFSKGAMTACFEYEFLSTNPKTGEEKWVENRGRGARNIHMIPSEIKSLLHPRYCGKIRYVVVRVPWGKKKGMITLLKKNEELEVVSA